MRKDEWGHCDNCGKAGTTIDDLRASGALCFKCRTSALSSTIEVGTPRKPMYCKDCGNCDCPNVNAQPYWTVCPAAERVAANKRRAELAQKLPDHTRDWCKGPSCKFHPGSGR